MSAPDIPSSYTIHTTVGGSLDMDLDEIRVKELPTIATEVRVKELPTIKSESAVTSESTVDMGLSDIRIRELPKVELCLEVAMKPTRVHLPVNLHFGLTTMGREILGLNLCGESMVVIEDYVPRRTEVCR